MRCARLQSHWAQIRNRCRGRRSESGQTSGRPSKSRCAGGALPECPDYAMRRPWAPRWKTSHQPQTGTTPERAEWRQFVRADGTLQTSLFPVLDLRRRQTCARAARRFRIQPHGTARRSQSLEHLQRRRWIQWSQSCAGRRTLSLRSRVFDWVSAAGSAMFYGARAIRKRR